MPQNTFTMGTQKQGRIKYLLITIVPPVAFMYLVMLLMQNGLIPQSRALGMASVYGSMAGMMIVSYFTIWKRNHNIEVKDNTLTEKNWRGNTLAIVKTSQISRFRKNILNEIILEDGDGRRLLCVESNMSNRDHFEQWLVSHHIESK